MKPRYLYFRIFLSLLIGFIPLPGIERKFFDFFLVLQRDQYKSQDIALLEFDRMSMLDAHNRLFNQDIRYRDSSLRPSDFPAWDDLIYSQLFSKLKQAQPKLVVMTYPFPSTIDETRTRLTVDAVRGIPVVWASRLLSEGGAEYPPSALTPYTNYGYGDFYPDSDGILRKVDLFRQGHVHLALRTLRDLGGSLDGLNLDRPQYMKLYSSAKEVPRLQLNQMLFEPVDTWEKNVKGKILYIGVEAPDVAPLKTPKGSYTRAEMHAVVLMNLFDPQGFIRHAPPWLEILIVLGMVSLTVLITFRTSVTWAGAIVLFQGVFLTVVAWFVFDHAHLSIQVASPLFTMIMTYALLAHFQLITQEEARTLAVREAENLKKVDEMKNNYMSLFSHDLNTPISKIDGICERILRTDHGRDFTEPQKREFELIARFNQELKNYIANILNLTKVESREFRLHKSVCDLNVLIEESVTKLKPLSESKKIHISTLLDPIFTMELDESLMKEILQNVILNSIKYCPEGSLVDIRTREEKKDVVVEVKDNGPGISPEDLRQVTDKFFRGKEAALTGKGSGLGLYLVKYFTELHGGEFVIESQVGVGTKVEIRFPVG